MYTRNTYTQTNGHGRFNTQTHRHVFHTIRTPRCLRKMANLCARCGRADRVRASAAAASTHTSAPSVAFSGNATHGDALSCCVARESRRPGPKSPISPYQAKGGSESERTKQRRGNHCRIDDVGTVKRKEMKCTHNIERADAAS